MIKNLYCKIVSVFCALSLFCVPAASAAVTLDAAVTSTDVTLTVKCGEEYAGKNIVVEVFEPAGSIDDLKSASGEYDVIDSATLDDALSCVYHGIADENGDLTFTFAPTGDKGKYLVRIGGAGMYTPAETYFEFVSDGDAAQVIENLIENLSVDTVAEIFEKPENENVYKPYQILNLDESAYYEAYDNADDTLKGAIHEYIRAGVEADNDITPDGFAQLFDDAVLVEGLNAAAEEDVVSYIAANDDALELTEKLEYTNIYSDTERFDEAVEEAFAAEIAVMDLSGKSVDDVSAAICDTLLLTALSNISSPGVLDDVICDFEDALESADADMDDYKDTSKPLDVCRDLIKLQPFDTLADFADELNDAIPAKTTSSSRPSSPSGGSTGVSYSGNAGSSASSVSIPLASDEDKADEELAFNDIDSVAWAHEAITALKDAGIISGKAEGVFAPNDNVTREEFVKMLVLALDLTDENGETPDFDDMNGNEWFAQYVYAAYNSGIVKGIGSGFGVGANITRQDMAVLCARALEYKGATLEATRTGMAFTDEISDYAAEAVEKLWSAGLVNGVSDTEFAPKAPATRAQAAKMLYEVLKAIG